MFGSLGAFPERPLTEVDHAISARMLDHWANFAKTGDPNDAAGGAWPRADVEMPVFTELGDNFAPLSVSVSASARAFWTEHYDANGQFRF